MGTMAKREFGVTRAGERVQCWTLEEGGHTAEILTYGAAVRSWNVPAAGGMRDIVLGFDTLADYEAQGACMGAVPGRVANRIGGARFVLDGELYSLPANDGPNCLHGGPSGFHRRVWQAREDAGGLVLDYVSRDGEAGFPGTLHATVRYTLEKGALTIAYTARTDRATLVNLTNHSYFNLEGAGTPTLEHHTVRILAEAITENDETSCPTGRLMDVAGTPFDLREPRTLLPGLESGHPQMAIGSGYDHNFVLAERAGMLRLAAVVEAGGLRLECRTDQPGVQLYTANHMKGLRGKGGAAYPRRCALCLETQNWPDAVHHAAFPSAVLRPGELYRHTTVYQIHRTGKSGGF